MITKRIIPCLDVRNGRVVKGTNFEGIRDVADPVEMARMYNAAGADELVFYDITASFEGRALFTDILTRVASEVFIPLTVGGGINTLEDFDRVLKCGADKVSVNSGALRDPDLIPAAARRYGNQCVVLSADVKRVNGQFRVFAKGGREDTGRDALDWIRWCVDHGAGEICLNSIDTDGVRNGFDLEMLDAVAARVDVPIIASGGAGKKEGFSGAVPPQGHRRGPCGGHLPPEAADHPRPERIPQRKTVWRCGCNAGAFLPGAGRSRNAKLDFRKNNPQNSCVCAPNTLN